MKNSSFVVIFGLLLLTLGCQKQSGTSTLAFPPPQAQSADDEAGIGGTWERVDFGSLQTLSPALESAAKRTGKFNGILGSGTVFYVGTYQNKMIAATNSHVVRTKIGTENPTACPYNETDPNHGMHVRIGFDLIPGKFICRGELVELREVDFALIEIVASDVEASQLKAVPPVRFSRSVPALRAPLLTLGYGSHPPTGARPSVGQSEKCMALAGETRFITDPDEVNPSAQHVWSFPVGCDASHGDSGSGIFDRTVPDLAWGLIWSGAFPKPLLWRNMSHVEAMVTAQDPSIWKSANYAVPSSKILEHLNHWLQSQPTATPATEAIRDLLKAQENN